ncbi:MAG: hypothetical protein AAF236_07320 [Verrucomicrobiota bacterium]
MKIPNVIGMDSILGETVIYQSGQKSESALSETEQILLECE